MRAKIRLPKIYKLLRNEKIFNLYFGKNKELRKYFEDNYEELLLEHIESTDLRLGQFFYNKGLITDELYNREDDMWFIGIGAIQPEDILTWGSYGVNGQNKYVEWQKSKPIYTEKEFGDENYELYAIEYNDWLNQKPKPTYKFLKDLDSNHIRNIMKDVPRLSQQHVDTFNKLLKLRGEEEIIYKTKRWPY